MNSDFRINEFKEQLLAASNKEEFLLLVNRAWLDNYSESNVLIEELVQLHNEGLVNLIAAFASLENKPDTGINFFQIRNVFETTLPKLNSGVAQVMECVLHLVTEAGQDLAAGTVFQPFIEYCVADTSRPLEGLKLIESSVTKYAVFLSPTLVAGSQIDFEHYLNEALRLACDDDIEIRRRAISSLGRLKYPEFTNSLKKAFLALESAVSEETDDILLANAVEAAFEVYQCDRTLDTRIKPLIDDALHKGNDFVLYAASRLFGLKCEILQDSLVDILLNHLQRTNSSHKGTLDNIDCGMASLLKKGEYDRSLHFLENLILKSEGSISLDVFDSTSYELLQGKNNIIGRIATRWFLQGNQQLCEGISSIIRLFPEQELMLSVEPSELNSSKFDELLFIARKAIGYLFFEPVSAASMIVSLIEYTSDDAIIQSLSELLFDPLLINYSGKVGDYLKQQLQVITAQRVREAIEEAMQAFEDYLTDLKSVGNIPELYPSQKDREAYRRRFSQQMSEAMRSAEKRSVLLSIFPKSVLLYGRKSIDYVYDLNGEARRMEIPLKSFGTEIEFPRLENIDPFGLDYVLRIFRVEQMIKDKADH
jgi:hypothetical protein